MDIGYIFPNQVLTFEQCGDAAMSCYHGVGYPCSAVGVVCQENPVNIYTSAVDEWKRDLKQSSVSCCRENPLAS